jgi:hypothetical protein
MADTMEALTSFATPPSSCPGINHRGGMALITFHRNGPTEIPSIIISFSFKIIPHRSLVVEHLMVIDLSSKYSIYIRVTSLQSLLN